MYEREQASILRVRLSEQPAAIIVVSGPRQVGKTTLVREVIGGYPSYFKASDQSIDDYDPFSNTGSTVFKSNTKLNSEWIIQQWTNARAQARTLKPGKKFVLVLDEIQKIPQWSDVVKGLWDTDRAENLPLHVILLGSSPWLMQKGLTESLAGRYELIRMSHWSYTEMQAAFDFSLDEFIYFGGYPGSAKLIRDEQRWQSYIRASLIQPNIEKDILQMTRVDKPALLKLMFELGSQYSGQIISYNKLVGQLQDAGNTVTLAHYLHLLTQAGLLTGLSKYAGEKHRQRSSSPKLNVLNTSLMSALNSYTFAEALADRSYWGRLVESAIGAHLYNTGIDECEVQYWREGGNEVDFILSTSNKLVAIEVKSGKSYAKPKGLNAFTDTYKKSRVIIVGEGGISIPEFL